MKKLVKNQNQSFQKQSFSTREILISKRSKVKKHKEFLTHLHRHQVLLLPVMQRAVIVILTMRVILIVMLVMSVMKSRS
jgi:hypothetical protein